jgi:pantetheine-phosphate adenylyltransferase
MRKAFYPGSFDPVTLGHMDIIRRAAAMVDHLTVSVLNNQGKTPLFSVEERVNILREAVRDIHNVEVDSFSGLLVEYAKEKDLHVVIRGLRAITDFEYELQLAQINRNLSGGSLDTIFLVTSLQYSFLSSSNVKEIAGFQGDISAFVPDCVVNLVREKYRIKESL